MRSRSLLALLLLALTALFGADVPSFGGVSIDLGFRILRAAGAAS